jgi:hypothetical protein
MGLQREESRERKKKISKLNIYIYIAPYQYKFGTLLRTEIPRSWNFFPFPEKNPFEIRPLVSSRNLELLSRNYLWNFRSFGCRHSELPKGVIAPKQRSPF